MRVVYVGDARDLRARVRQHCSGNVEASALRKHVAVALGLGVRRERRADGKSTRLRIDLPEPVRGEEAVSAYLHDGLWRGVVCESAVEARDFQWFAIDRLRPELNRDRRAWAAGAEARYVALLDELRKGEPRRCGEGAWPPAPGVYALWHGQTPAP